MPHAPTLWHPDAIKYEYTRDTLSMLWDWAWKRTEPKLQRPDIVRDKRRKLYGNRFMHFVGLLGEYAFELFSGVPFDRRIGYSGDSSGDFIFHGKRVEVKTSYGYLIIDPGDIEAEILVCATYQNIGKEKVGNEVSLQGYITRDGFLARFFEDDFGYGTKWCMQPADLCSITLMNRI